MFQDNALEWQEAIHRKLMSSTSGEELYLNIWKHVVPVLNHQTIVRCLVDKQRNPFLNYYRMLRDQGVSLADITPMIADASKLGDMELLEWVVEHEQEPIPYISSRMDHLLAKKHVKLLSHPLMDDNLVQVILNFTKEQ
jgi:hypothetical protein